MVRNGVMSQLPAQEMTVGDRFDLMKGERVPCDCILTDFQQVPFNVDESIISGSSQSVLKQTFTNQ